ncbi:MAG TPA: SpoVR family protein [Polyangiaceae bacterium]|nr:SpoVR family protein [Polyangiaceae bacterium]
MAALGFSAETELPAYLKKEQDKIEKTARSVGLDFFPTVFEILSYDRLNEIAAYGGFPTRYPHWRFGMEYERLAKSYEYGLSKIYEMVINTNPAIAYLLEGNSLTDQKLVMCHVYGHVDFFKNNFTFRSTDLDTLGRVVPTEFSSQGYDPNRRWIDKMANHGSVVRRLIARHGVEPVEAFVDACLSLENLIDPHAPFIVRKRVEDEPEEGRSEPEVPRLRAKDYMEDFINPDSYLEAERKKMQTARDADKGRFPKQAEQDVLLFLIENAPLEKWERAVLTVIREEAYYYLPQMQTKIMNEGWASYNHSLLMTQHVADFSEIVDYADNNAGVMATNGKSLNPYKLGVELFRHIEERWNKGQFGREYDQCDDLDERRHWDLRLGLGKKKIFEVRQIYNDVTFLDEFLTPEFAMENKLFTFEWSERRGGYEVATREFQKVKQKLLSQLTNAGNPVIRVLDANFENKGELLLKHDHQGIDLRVDYAERVLESLVRVWKRPVLVATRVEEQPLLLRFDGKEHSRVEGQA